MVPRLSVVVSRIDCVLLIVVGGSESIVPR